MAKSPLHPLGPWPKGVNNVDDTKSAAFQATRRKPASLAAARNIDLDQFGWPRRRPGRTKRLDLTSGHSLFSSSDGRMFLVDDGALFEVFRDFSQELVDPDVGNAPLSYAEVAGQILYSNETKVGAVDSFWGVDTPSSPFLDQGIGTLPSGLFQVAVTAVRDGVESGVHAPGIIEVSSPGGIEAHVAGLDLHAQSVNIYMSMPDGSELFLVREAPRASGPVIISDLPPTTDPLTSVGLYPPPPGQHIALFRGRMLVASGAALYWSQPLAYHHFRIQSDVQLFSDRIVMLAALDSGFFVATADHSTYWVGGSEPDNWQPLLVDSRAVADCEPLRLPARKLPALQAPGEVLVWATADGFCAGASNGTVVHLTDGRLAVDAFKQAALGYREENGLRQILMSLQSREADARFGATDRVSCRVIRADESTGEP